jgi:hypothetical protein
MHEALMEGLQACTKTASQVVDLQISACYSGVYLPCSALT